MKASNNLRDQRRIHNGRIGKFETWVLGMRLPAKGVVSNL